MLFLAAVLMRIGLLAAKKSWSTCTSTGRLRQGRVDLIMRPLAGEGYWSAD